MKVVSLFSGYGSQELALKYLGINFEPIAHCDIYSPANQVFSVLHTTVMGNLGDITKIDETQFPDCDFLTYSFPCQDISISGIQKGIEIGTRSGLLFEVERIVSHKQPKYLLMENVKNLISVKHRANFQRHIEFLNELGYGCGWSVFNAADYGCPQNRERVLMMSVQGMTNEQVTAMMNQAKDNKVDRIPMRGFIETENVPDEFYVNCEITPFTPKKKSICRMVAARNDVNYDQAKRIYSIDGCSPCLTKTGVPQIMLDNNRVRRITPRESYRFMGVQEHDIDKMLTVNIPASSHSGLAGNSICVPVMQSIFKVFFNCG
jgi:DNA (cytosine-5)-methyltransferase 1